MLSPGDSIARDVTAFNGGVRRTYHSDAGLLGLEAEIRALADEQLDEMADLLAGITRADWALAYHRRRLVAAEVAQRRRRRLAVAS